MAKIEEYITVRFDEEQMNQLKEAMRHIAREEILRWQEEETRRVHEQG